MERRQNSCVVCQLTKREGGKSPFRLNSELSTQIIVDSRTIVRLSEEWRVKESADGGSMDGKRDGIVAEMK